MDPIVGLALGFILLVEMAIIFLWICGKVLERMIEKEKDDIKLKRYWKISILISSILGFITIIPWYNVRANFLGYYSICSFAPFSAFIMFNIALALYVFVTKRRKTFYVTTLILLIIFGFTGWWFYDFKSPMDSIECDIAIRSFWIGTTHLYDTEENASYMSFYLTFKNPINRDTPIFLIEPWYIAINNKKLVSGYYLSCWNGSHLWCDFRWFYEPTTLKPQENITLLIENQIYYNQMEVEGASREEVWASLMQRNFTLSIVGILTVRPLFSESMDSYPTVQHKSTWAAKPFIVSQKYG